MITCHIGEIKMRKTGYYKGLDENLCGKNGFQYEIGEEFTADTDDDLHWLHFTKSVSNAIEYGPRVVEVKPITKIMKSLRSKDMNAKTIRIVRELSRQEIIENLIDERCHLYKMTRFKPDYRELRWMKYCIRPDDYQTICYGFDWLTLEEKLTLLPENWKKRARMYDQKYGKRPTEKPASAVKNQK